MAFRRIWLGISRYKYAAVQAGMILVVVDRFYRYDRGRRRQLAVRPGFLPLVALESSRRELDSILPLEACASGSEPRERSKENKPTQVAGHAGSVDQWSSQIALQRILFHVTA